MDIVNELRKHGKIAGCGLALSAADEIERLRTTLVDLDSAFSFHPSCQKNVIARCGCIVCAKERMRELLTPNGEGNVRPTGADS